MVTLQCRVTLPTGVLFLNVGLCSLLGFLKAGHTCEPSEVCRSSCPGPDEEVSAVPYLDRWESIPNICLQSAHPFEWPSRGEGRMNSWREVGKEGQTAPLRGRQQAQMFAAADGRLPQSRPQYPRPARGKEREREAGQAPLEPQS